MNGEVQSTSVNSNSRNTADLEKADLAVVYQSLATSPQGLTSADAKERLDQYGRNELVDQEVSKPMKFLAFF
ncbi:protein containing ATPase, P-type cation-transporter, N-terminal domain, partial [methanotrophic bacterial endosymbiont of Bathymodiolus sp.]